MLKEIPRLDAPPTPSWLCSRYQCVAQCHHLLPGQHPVSQFCYLLFQMTRVFLVHQCWIFFGIHEDSFPREARWKSGGLFFILNMTLEVLNPALWKQTFREGFDRRTLFYGRLEQAGHQNDPMQAINLHLFFWLLPLKLNRLCPISPSYRFQTKQHNSSYISYIWSECYQHQNWHCLWSIFVQCTVEP